MRQAIEECILKKHGSPKRIYSDNGLEFLNDANKEMCKIHGIEWITNSPGHHKAVGGVERVNRTLWDKIRKLSNFGNHPWEEYVEKAAFALNISFHRALGTSPYVWRYAKIPKPILELLGIETDIRVKRENLITRRKAREYKYKKEIEKGKRTVPYNLNINDPVLIYKNPPGNKIKAKWIPNFKIKERSLPDAYIVSNGKSHLKLNKTHVKKKLCEDLGKGEL